MIDCIEDLLPSDDERSLRNLCARPGTDGHRCVEQIRDLIRAGTNVNARRRQENPFLQVACSSGNHVAAKELLEAGAEVNARNRAGFTALHEAALLGSTALCELLLRYGADPDLAAEDGTGPVHQAARYGRWPCCALLLAQGLDPDLGCVPSRLLRAGDEVPITRSVLYYAALSRQPDTFLGVIAAGGDPRRMAGNVSVDHEAPKREFTIAVRYPLHYAARHDHWPACESLLERGWDLRERNGSRLQPMDVARQAAADRVLAALQGWQARQKALEAVRQSGLPAQRIASGA